MTASLPIVQIGLSLTLRVQFHTRLKRRSFYNALALRLFVCLCLTSHRQRGHSETAPPFTVPCEGREAR